MQTYLGTHHHHIRKRIYENLEAYPHPNRFKSLFDKLIVLVAIFGVLMTFPQVLQIWINKNVAGLSIFTWSTYFIASIFWLTYGLLHKEKIIVFSNSMGVVLNFFIVAGIIMFR